MSKNKNKQHRYKVYKKSNFKCVYCSRKFIPPLGWDMKSALFDGEMYLELDHINPVSKGGNDKIINKQSLCGKCNLLKSDFSEYQFYHRMIEKRNHYFNDCFLWTARIEKFRSRGKQEYELRAMNNFRNSYLSYRYRQKVVVYLSKYHK